MKKHYFQHKPDLTVRFSPRVSPRLRKTVNQICERSEMPETDVLRYSFEAVVLSVGTGKMRFSQTPRTHLEAMVTVRTSRKMARKTVEIFERLKKAGVEPMKPHHPQYSHLMYSDVLRGLIDMAVKLARAKGMAHVMALREKNLTRARG